MFLPWGWRYCPCRKIPSQWYMPPAQVWVSPPHLRWRPLLLHLHSRLHRSPLLAECNASMCSSNESEILVSDRFACNLLAYHRSSRCCRLSWCMVLMPSLHNTENLRSALLCHCCKLSLGTETCRHDLSPHHERKCPFSLTCEVSHSIPLLLHLKMLLL